MKIALGVEYDGSHFHGWQRQPNLTTVQAEVERAISKVASEDVQVFCAGRTDTAVHATGQVIHFETQVERPERAWLYGTNQNLCKGISISFVKPVSDDFHARFSATARRYRYVIYNETIRPALLRSHLSWHYQALNETLMHEAAQALIGEHDFTSFRALGCQSRTAMRNLHQISVTRQGSLVIMDIKANAFLYHMVRNIAGVLMAIGSGQQPVSWIHELLKAKDRSQGGVTAPPYGLYLAEVYYPDEFNLPRPRPLLLGHM